MIRPHRCARYPALALAAFGAILIPACSTVPSVADEGIEQDAALARAHHLLSTAILIDGHNDLPWVIRTSKEARGDPEAYDLRGRTPGHTDIARLRAGRVGAQFWSVYTPGEVNTGFAATQLEQIDLARRMIARYPDEFAFATTAAEIRAAHREGRIASLLGIEGGHAIENSLGVLRSYYDLGVRYMTLTHNVHTDWADTHAMPPRHGGLTPFGEQVVLEMNRLGMLVDLSHASVATMKDALRVSKAPVIFSHSSARALVDVSRNVPDEMLRRLRVNGGVVMVAFVASFVDADAALVIEPVYEEISRRVRELETEQEREALYEKLLKQIKAPRVSVSAVADHIEHIRNVAGIEHVGIGADYDGNEFWPEGLEDVSGYPLVFAELIRRGWSERELELLAGENVLRALERAEVVAAELQMASGPGTARIGP